MAIALLMTACGTETFNAGVKIPLEVYDKDFQTASAEEYAQLQEESKIKILVDDYGDLREVVRCFNNLPQECESPR